MTVTKTASNVPAFSGKGKSARVAAFGSISRLAFAEATTRAEAIANMRIVLGSHPSELEIAAAKTEHVIGIVACKLPESKVPLVKTPEQRMARAIDLVRFYAQPPKEGSPARKLKAHQKGYRTAVEQRIIRNAAELASTFLAELGLNGAKTNAERNKARAPSMAGSGKGKKAAPAPAPAAPDHSVLVKPSAPVTTRDYVNHMQTQLAALLAFDNKHAKVRPVTHSAFAEQLAALKQTANKAANAFAEREAAEQAKQDIAAAADNKPAKRK